MTLAVLPVVPVLFAPLLRRGIGRTHALDDHELTADAAPAGSARVLPLLSGVKPGQNGGRAASPCAGGQVTTPAMTEKCSAAAAMTSTWNSS